MDNEKYRGWHNYATWRVKFEWFDDDDWLREMFYDLFIEPYDLADKLRDYVEEGLELTGSGVTLDYAKAFIDDVDWHEIAERIVDEWKEKRKKDK